MTLKSMLIATTAAATLFVGGAFAATPHEQAAYAAHEAYLTAINANDLDRFLDTLTEDIVFIAPNVDLMEGKADVAPWVGGYFEAYRTSWEKHSIEFVVASDWAFERYTYLSVDKPRDGGKITTDVGNGISIYRLEADGVWRVARDAWASTQPPLTQSAAVAIPTCTGVITPC